MHDPAPARASLAWQQDAVPPLLPPQKRTTRKIHTRTLRAYHQHRSVTIAASAPAWSAPPRRLTSRDIQVRCGKQRTSRPPEGRETFVSSHRSRKVATWCPSCCRELMTCRDFRKKLIPLTALFFPGLMLRGGETLRLQQSTSASLHAGKAQRVENYGPLMVPSPDRMSTKVKVVLADLLYQSIRRLGSSAPAPGDTSALFCSSSSQSRQVLLSRSSSLGMPRRCAPRSICGAAAVKH